MNFEKQGYKNFLIDLLITLFWEKSEKRNYFSIDKHGDLFNREWKSIDFTLN